MPAHGSISSCASTLFRVSNRRGSAGLTAVLAGTVDGGGPGHAFNTSRITLMAEEYGDAKFLSK
jgi:hypothetical protein